MVSTLFLSGGIKNPSIVYIKLGMWVSHRGGGGDMILHKQNFRLKGHPRVTIIIPIRRCRKSERESLFSRGSHECLGGSPGADGGQFHPEKVISTAYIFL